MKSICVVLVTYNRIHDLKKTLEAYEKQKLLPSEMIIVDNASTDGTKEYLSTRKFIDDIKVKVITSKKNVGGAGGFCMGIKEALLSKPDYVFLADDDAVPEEKMLVELLRFDDKCDSEDIAALCTAVIDQNGYSGVQRGRIKKGILSIRREIIKQEEYRADSLDIDLLTFVGAMIKRKTIEEIGLPISEYFIHEDDAEYSTRIRKIGRIVCVTASKIYHPHAPLNAKNWIEYYTTRNYVNYIGRHYSKRYQYYVAIEKYIKKCSIIAVLMRNRGKAFRDMNREAIRDGFKNKLGISDKYYPGVDIK